MKPKKIKIAPKWSKSKEDIWDETFFGLEDFAENGKIKRVRPWRYMWAAAVVFAVIMLSASYFYSVTEISVRGAQLAVVLPDGSKVSLNADSRLSYRPIWWFVTRNVELSGEAYFEVQHGRRFSVLSGGNRVSVLGTSFNVFSRPERYAVTCLTGRVQVAANKQTSLLTPDMRLTSRDGKITVQKKFDATQSIGWTRSRFVFVGIPLPDVIREVERQYNIQITTKDDLDHTFTGNFSKTENPGQVLDIIGSTFGIKLSYKNK
ncbi:MAG: fec operon regulator FecR [Bacteroidetes bacterium]|nr:fec operon regulator FecR [Bacteroidota bacterium]